MNNNFFNLLKYNEVPSLCKNPHDILNELNMYMNNNNEAAYDLINYERLIYIERNYSDNPNIQMKLSELKNTISNNYIRKEQLKARIIHHYDLDCNCDPEKESYNSLKYDSDFKDYIK